MTLDKRTIALLRAIFEGITESENVFTQYFYFEIAGQRVKGELTVKIEDHKKENRK